MVVFSRAIWATFPNFDGKFEGSFFRSFPHPSFGVFFTYYGFFFTPPLILSPQSFLLFFFLLFLPFFCDWFTRRPCSTAWPAAIIFPVGPLLFPLPVSFINRHFERSESTFPLAAFKRNRNLFFFFSLFGSPNQVDSPQTTVSLLPLGALPLFFPPPPC